MDFKGQALAEKLLVYLLLAFAAIGFVAGFAAQNFLITVYVNGAGLALTLLLVLPDWPFYNRNSLKWLPACPVEPVEPAPELSLWQRAISLLT